MSAKLYGLLAEFRSADELAAATQRALQYGYKAVEAYSPFPIEGLGEMLGAKTNGIARSTLCGGIVGGAAAYFLQWYAAVIDYPINVGGRPLHSWPAFIPITFEMVVLGAALGAVFSLMRSNGLPRLRHPLFGARDFDLASRNRFFLCIDRSDARFDATTTREFLQSLQPLHLSEVRHDE